MKTDLFIRLIISAKTQHLYNLNGFSLFVHFHNNIDYRKEFLLFCRCTVTSQWILCIIIIVVTTITYIFITNRASLIAELVKNPPACRRPSSIPGLGLSPGEGIGYSFYYSWASLVAQLVKNLPAMRRPGFNPWVGKISWRRERLHSSVFWPGEFHGLSVHGVAKSGTQLSNFHFLVHHKWWPEKCLVVSGYLIIYVW